MKSKVFISLFAASILMTGFSSCNSDDPKPDPTIEEVKGAAIFGRVYDKSTFTPIEGAVVKVGDKSVATSDKDGQFSFDSEDNKKISLAVAGTGYFPTTVEVDHASEDHVGSVATVSVALMKEVKSMDVDPTKDNSVALPALNGAPGALVNFPANVLPADIRNIHAVNYVLPQANSYGSLYLHPWGTPLVVPVEVGIANTLPADVVYDGVQVVDNGSTTGSKATSFDVTHDVASNAYVFTISSFGNFAMSVNVTATEGQIVTDNSPYQTISVDNACAQNTVYEWKQCVKTVSGYELKTKLSSDIASKFPGISADGAKLIEDEVMRMVVTFKNAVPGKIEREVCVGSVKINPGTMNVYTSYQSTRTSTMAFNFKYKGNAVKLDVEMVEYLGVKGENKAYACGDHSGGGGHSGGGTN
ncbi:MAG: hypothetical protein ACRDD6_07245 [Tannerellaceae bacterium]